MRVVFTVVPEGVYRHSNGSVHSFYRWSEPQQRAVQICHWPGSTALLGQTEVFRVEQYSIIARDTAMA